MDTLYVTDDRDRLAGFVALRELVLADPEMDISKLMDTDFKAAGVDDEIEDVAELFEKYDFMSLPVIEPNGLLLGVIGVDDILEVVVSLVRQARIL